MADDSLNEGSEEEKKSSDGGFSDDDFGLPDLEFDDLEELDMSEDDSDDDDSASEDFPETKPELSGETDFDMSLLEDIPDTDSDIGSGLQEGDLDPPKNTALDQGIDEVEDVLDSAQLISDRLGDDDGDSSEIDYDALMNESSSAPAFEDDSSTDTSDLFADIDSPDDLAALGMADEDDDDDSDSATLESGSSLFSADDDDDDSDSIFGSDSLSMDVSDDTDEFETEDSDGALPPNYKAYTYEESSGGFTKIVVIGIVAIALVAAGLLYFNSSNEANKTAAKVEKKVVPKKVVPEKVEKENPEEQTEPVEVAKVQAKPKAVSPKPKPKAEVMASSASPGEIQMISARTAKSYIIVGSFVDGDMAMDYANKLSAQGKGVKIIQPYGKSKRHRVSVADYDTYGDAAGQLDSFKEEFGDQVWALKY